MTLTTGYTQMKDSGIPWVGSIPAEWNIRVLFQLVNQVKCKNSDLQEQNLLSLSYGKIKRKNIDKADGLLPASFDGYNIIENGDIVLRLTDLQNDHTSLRVGRATERGIITSAYTTLRPTNPSISKYIYYLLHTFDIKKGFYGMGSGVRQGLNFDEVKMLKLPVPSYETQEAIVTYLDAQCAKIDEIIAEAKASIEDYKQWKASVIYEAVTKGLDPDAEMKESGVEKIGRIPLKWTTIKLKYLLNIKSGDAIGAEDMLSDGKYPVYGGGEAIGFCNKYNADENNLLIGRVGTRCGCVTAPQTPSWATDNALIVECKELRAYLHYLLLSADLNSLNTSNAQPLITGTKIKNCVVVFTDDVAEQKEIAAFLNEKTRVIDSFVSEKEALISDLESYKKSLIYEIVTGKRSVI